jgi:hypothetical protein
MKKGITLALALVFAVMVGGLSMGCIDKTVEDAFIPEVTVEEIAEEPIIIGGLPVPPMTEEPTVVDKPIVVYKPTLVYSKGYVKYPENLAGFDTIRERAIKYQAMLDKKMAAMETLTVSQYLSPNGKPYEEFYLGLYQQKLDDYTAMYLKLGNKVLSDGGYRIEHFDNVTGNYSYTYY